MSSHIRRGIGVHRRQRTERKARKDVAGVRTVEVLYKRRRIPVYPERGASE